MRLSSVPKAAGWRGKASPPSVIAGQRLRRYVMRSAVVPFPMALCLDHRQDGVGDGDGFKCRFLCLFAVHALGLQKAPLRPSK